MSKLEKCILSEVKNSSNPEFNIIYWVENPLDKEHHQFSSGNKDFEISVLEEYNLKGFNIYQSVNTFVGYNRKKEDLAEIRACFIDIDYPELKNFGLTDENKKKRASFLKEKFESEVKPTLLEVKKLYNITPSEINVTQKGLHIIYGYESECYFIDIVVHEAINNLLGEKFGGDQNARDVARVYKKIGYIDWKGGNRGKIKSLNPEQSEKSVKKISKEIIESKIGFKFEKRDDKKIYENFYARIFKEKKQRLNRDKINAIDSKIFVDKLNEYFTYQLKNPKGTFSIESLEMACNRLKYAEKGNNTLALFESDGKNLTSGLTISDEDGIYRFFDYSKKNRSTNINFFSNWIFPLFEFGKDEYPKQLNIILSNVFGLNLRTNLEKKIPINEKLYYDFFYGRIDFLGYKKKVMNKKNPLSKIPQINSVGKVYFALLSYIHDRITKNNKIRFDSEKKAYVIEFTDFMNFSFKNIDTEAKRKYHKKNIIPILKKISEIRIFFENESKGISEWKKIFEIEFPKTEFFRGKKEIFLIYPFEKRDFAFGPKEALFNFNILSFQDSFENTKITDFLLYAEAMTLGKGRDFTIKADYIYEFLELKGENKSKLNTLRKHLSKAISNKYNIFGSYSIQKGNLYLSKFKKERSEFGGKKIKK